MRVMLSYMMCSCASIVFDMTGIISSYFIPVVLMCKWCILLLTKYIIRGGITMKEFTFSPAPWIPFRDKEVLERVRNMKREDLEKHSNPDFKIKIIPNYSGIVITDMVMRMKQSDDLDETLVMIIPNPDPAGYMQVAELVNHYKINCRNVHIFSMDEWAD